jgi:hypothetical protein
LVENPRAFFLKLLNEKILAPVGDLQIQVLLFQFFHPMVFAFQSRGGAAFGLSAPLGIVRTWNGSEGSSIM